MSESLRRLLQGAFDYAGLLPPTSLGLGQGCDQLIRLRSGPDSWLANRFCCPIEDLDALLAILKSRREEIEVQGPWRIAVQGSALEAFKHDLWAIEKFEKASEPLAEVESYEVRIEGRTDIENGLKHLANAGFEDSFVDVSWGEGAADLLLMIAQAGSVGARVRLAGSDASPAPTAGDLAAVLQDCVNLDVAIKLVDAYGTPVRSLDASTAMPRHGFLNAMVGICLAAVHDLSRREIEQVLEEDDPEAFWFSNGGLGWRDWEASNDEVDAMRGLASSVGTGSIELAASNLRARGFLAETARAQP